jgi:hypothetical protein
MLMAELKYERFRQKANKIIHETEGRLFDLILLGLILLSVLLVMMETVLNLILNTILPCTSRMDHHRIIYHRIYF